MPDGRIYRVNSFCLNKLRAAHIAKLRHGGGKQLVDYILVGVFAQTLTQNRLFAKINDI